MRNVALTVLMLISPALAFAEPPRVLVDALEAYKKDGVEAFIPKLISGSPIDGDKDALSKVNNMRQVEGYYGAMKGFEILETFEISGRARETFWVINYENGPLFGVASTYKGEKGEVLYNFNINTRQELIIPEGVRYK